MTTKKINLWIYLVPILVLIILGILIAVYFIPRGNTPQFSVPVGCRSSVLSIDDISLTRDSNELGEKVFQITLSGREGGQCIVGYINSNDLAQKIGQKLGKTIQVKYSDPFAITMRRNLFEAYYSYNQYAPANTRRYEYTPTGNPLTTFSTLVTCKTGSLVQRSCSSQCADSTYSNSNCEGTINTKCYCFDLENIGSNYPISNERLRERMDVTIVTGDGNTKIASLDTDTTREYNFASREDIQAYASFEGYLQGTQLIPDVGSARLLESAGTKKVITGGSPLQDPLCQNRIDYSQIESCMISYNRGVDSFLYPKSSFRDATFSGTSIIIPISKDIYYPIIKIQVKAKWLGIYEPVAEPDIFNCQNVNTEFRNQREVMSSYELKLKPNTGEQGTFNIYATCNNGFNAVPTENTKTIVGTETEKGQIRITQQNNEDTSTSCTLKASIERLGYSKEDTCIITVAGQKSCAIVGESCSTNTNCCEGLECISGACKEKIGVEICYNQKDDDNDGLIDCLDSDCGSSIYCGGEDNETCKLTTCNECGTGIFNLCDKNECESCSTQLGCTFTPSIIGIGGSCKAPDTTCKSCWSWLTKFIKPEAEQCTEGIVFGDNWLARLFGAEIKQGTWCPLITVFYVSIGLIVIAIVFAIIVPALRRKKK